MQLRLGLVFVCTAVVFHSSAAAWAQATQPVKAIVVTQSKGFEHDVVKEASGQPSLVEKTFRELAERSKLFTLEHTKDASILTPEKLTDTKLIVLYTTGDLPVAPELLDKWVNDGGALLGIHPATDTFKESSTFFKLIGGTFDGHPWDANETVTIKVHDRDHPASRPWGAGDTFKEEIYLHKNFDPKTCRVLISLDMERTALKKPRHTPIAWCKHVGKGKVFYTSLGHREDVWTNPKYQQHLTGAIAWLLGAEKGDATPNPQTSAQEEEIAKKAVAERNREFPEVPDPFAVAAFVRAPLIKPLRHRGSSTIRAAAKEVSRVGRELIWRSIIEYPGIVTGSQGIVHEDIPVPKYLERVHFLESLRMHHPHADNRFGVVQIINQARDSFGAFPVFRKCWRPRQQR